MSYGNPPMDGISKNLTSKPGSLPNRPGKITKGPGKNKVKMHLIASHGKMPAEIYAHAVAMRQGATTGPTHLPNPVAHKTNPEVYKAQAGTAVGVRQENRTLRPQRKELTKKYNKDAAVMAARASQPPGVAPLPMVQFDKRSSVQRRRDAMARRA